MKVVVNRCFGGFGLSGKAIKRYLELTGRECYFYNQTKYAHEGEGDEYSITDENNNGMFVHCSTKDLGKKTDKIPREHYFYYGNIERNDENLVRVVEELGEKADGSCASLDVITIPNGVSWEIDDYDGQETIHEVHRSW